MNPKTDSEILFEAFCKHHGLLHDRIPEALTPRPDYRLMLGDVAVAVEIKQFDELIGFNPSGVCSRTPGKHIRTAIKNARSQIKWAGQYSMPGMLIIHNARDPFQLFGTEEHDYITAMYGELTAHFSVENGQRGAFFHGKNAKLRADENTCFSGVAHLVRRGAHPPTLTIYENIYATYTLPFEQLATYADVKRVTIEEVDPFRPTSSERLD